MYPSAGRALHTLGRKVGGGTCPQCPPGSAASGYIPTRVHYNSGTFRPSPHKAKNYDRVEMEVKVTYIEGARGHQVPVLDGYSYYKSKATTKGTKLVCSKRKPMKCGAYLIR